MNVFLSCHCPAHHALRCPEGEEGQLCGKSPDLPRGPGVAALGDDHPAATWHGWPSLALLFVHFILDIHTQVARCVVKFSRFAFDPMHPSKLCESCVRSCDGATPGETRRMEVPGEENKEEIERRLRWIAAAREVARSAGGCPLLVVGPYYWSRWLAHVPLFRCSVG